jgi:hypothetical protein
MNTGTFFWMIVFAISAATFFLVAAIVTFKGFRDLLDLLRTSGPADHDPGVAERFTDSPRSEPPKQV